MNEEVGALDHEFLCVVTDDDLTDPGKYFLKYCYDHNIIATLLFIVLHGNPEIFSK